MKAKQLSGNALFWTFIPFVYVAGKQNRFPICFADVMREKATLRVCKGCEYNGREFRTVRHEKTWLICGQELCNEFPFEDVDKASVIVYQPRSEKLEGVKTEN